MAPYALRRNLRAFCLEENMGKKLSRKGTAHYIGVSVVTLDRLYRSEQLGHHRIGRRVLFDVTEHLDKFFESKELAGTNASAALTK